MADITFTKIPDQAQPAVTFKKVETGPPPSGLSRFGTGAADPLVGILQATGRQTGEMVEPPLWGSSPTAPQDLSVPMDAAVKKREQDYQASRGANPGTDWARGAGNIASNIALTAPLALAGPGATAASMAARIAQTMRAGAGFGALEGVTEPVTSGSFGTGKAKQIGGGATEGALLGGGLGTLGEAIARNTPEGVERFIQSAYERSIKPSFAGRSGSGQQLAEAREKARAALDAIIDNRDVVTLLDKEGRELPKGTLPQTVEHVVDAVDQSKKKIFEKYDAMANAAGEGGVAVDLRPAAAELRQVAQSPEIRTLKPDLAEYANKRADALESQGTFTATQAQTGITHLNDQLKSFYNKPNYENAWVDSMIANKLRHGLDDAVSSVAGAGYQALKNQYGALRSIENDVVRRAIVMGRQEPGGGILGRLVDVASAHDLVNGVMHPASIPGGLLMKAWGEAVKRVRDPNRAVRRMFEKADKIRSASRAVESVAPPLPPIIKTGMQPPRPTDGAMRPAKPGTPAPAGGSAQAAPPTAPIPVIRQPPVIQPEWERIIGGGNLF